MPAPSKKRLSLDESLGKARDSLANKRKEDHQQAFDVLNEENRQLRAELQHEKMLKRELRAALSRAEKRVEKPEKLILPEWVPNNDTRQTLLTWHRFGRCWVHSTRNEFPITPSPNAPRNTYAHCDLCR
ncbi:hypothetical protein L596_002651 [Steinernema carpocapsae]|uniref:Uncharacterized protein n=1 Tax=Steinernema carpocapsae TaxID=34508 RepID=A0A4U8UPU8_STECR|nr:hypothetical protein L596_002651 [Steinernema carpocapsae]